MSRLARVGIFGVGVVALVGAYSASPFVRAGHVQMSSELGRYVDGTVVESPGSGPMLATRLLLTLPPGGGDVRLSDWRWSLIEDLGGIMEADGYRWSAEAVRVIGTWDGDSLKVSDVARPTAALPAPINVSSDPVCEVLIDRVQVEDTKGVIAVSTEHVDGGCIATVHAVGPSPEIEALLDDLQRQIDVEPLYLLKRA